MTKKLILLMGVVFGLSFSVMAKKNGNKVYLVENNKSTLEWVGKKVTGKHYGSLKITKGSLVLKGRDLVGGEFIVDMSTIKNVDVATETYRKKLEKHLKSEDFFHVKKHKTAKLKITDVVFGKGGVYNISALLTIKDITKPILFDANLIHNKKNVLLKGVMRFNRVHYGIKYKSGSVFKSLGDKMIYDDVLLRFNIQSKK